MTSKVTLTNGVIAQAESHNGVRAGIVGLKDAAVLSGLGIIGQNNLLLHPEMFNKSAFLKSLLLLLILKKYLNRKKGCVDRLKGAVPLMRRERLNRR